MSDCGHQTPLARFLSHTDAHARPWLIAHLNELSESDFKLLAQARPNFSIVHCPRSHRYFRHTPFPFARLRALGFNVCLGTDSLASNEDLNLFAEMRRFQETFPDIAPDEVLAMTTRNGAEAMGRSNELGKLAKHYFPDMIAVPFSGSRENLMETIIGFEGEPWVGFTGNTAED
jgi:cytosine/adenosine deaminase-related metal-dependent hydrolase